MMRHAAAFLLVLSCTRIAAADYMTPYRKGFEAFNWFRWEVAAAEMRKAIAENPVESGTPVHIRLLAWKPYVPHFYLGISLEKLGRCSEAVPALQESLRQGVLPDNYRRRAEQTLKKCPAAASEPDGAEESSAPPLEHRTSPTIEPGVEQQRAAPLPRSRETVASPPAQREKTPIRQQETAPPPPATQERPVAATPVESRRVSEVDSERSIGEPVVPVGVQNPTDRLLASTRTMPAAATPQAPADPPAALVTAVDAYLRGRYRDAVRILDSTVFSDPAPRAHAILFRAAALHALFVISQQRDASLRARAANDVIEYRRLRPRGPIDARVFSPAFLQFVQEAAR